MKISTQTSYAVRALGMEGGIRLLCNAGYDALDLSLFEMSNDDSPFNKDNYREYAKWVRSIADRYGVTFNQAHAPFVFNWADDNVYHDIAQPRVLRSLEITALVGARNIVVHPLHYLPYKGNEQELHRMNIEYYKSFIPYCQEYGIKVAVENMWRRDPVRKYIIDSVCSRSTDLAAMVDELNDIAPCFTACLDVGHSVLTGEEAEDAIRVLGAKRLGALHIHDNNYIADQHTLPGLGIMNWQAITDALREIGYCGEFTYEADSFLKGFAPDVLHTAAHFMVDIARYWAAKCE